MAVTGLPGRILAGAQDQQAVLNQTSPAGDYRLQPGDVIEVKFFYNPDLNERVEVGPDGKISLQLVNEIRAAGLTREELRTIIQQGYGKVLKVAEATVIIRTFIGQRIFVGGEVNSPGLFALEGEMNILQAIVRAGGLKNTARASEVILIRKGPGNAPLHSYWNVDKLFKGKGDKVVSLQPFDVVFVPKSKVTNVNLFIDQYIRQNVPLPLVLGFNFLSTGVTR